MLKIGVLGAGHLGKIHIKCLRQIDNYKLIGFYDSNPEVASSVEKEFGITNYKSINDLITDVDVVDIVTPTLAHFDCASKALRKTRHVFIEKPIVTTPDEASKLIALAEEAGVKVQVGHVERFNPAYLTAANYINNPMFIETHRLAHFNPRGTDVPVVLDLMIHDIDIVLNAVKANVRKIHASGIPIVSETPDIANARLEFDNGCVANLTASRISLKNMRKSRFFQKDAYIAVDFLEKSMEIVRIEDIEEGKAKPLDMILDMGEGKSSKKISIEKPEVQTVNAIMKELETFHDAIINNQTPPVSIHDGYNALDIAYQIMEKIDLYPKLIK